MTPAAEPLQARHTHLQLGIGGASIDLSLHGWVDDLLALKLRLGTLPAGMDRGQVVGVGALGGIGFTVLLFIADLAFTPPLLTDAAKAGIFLGSIVAGILGALLLTRPERDVGEPQPSRSLSASKAAASRP